MIGWCEACGKGPVPCTHIQSSAGSEGARSAASGSRGGMGVGGAPVLRDSYPTQFVSLVSSCLRFAMAVTGPHARLIESCIL
jgi:hypothetical protein